MDIFCLISSGKHLERIHKAHTKCSLYKLITSSKDSNDLSNWFDESNARPRLELTEKKKPQTWADFILEIV